MLYLELGCVPFGQLIMKRRILFLHYILNQDKESMLKRFLVAQMRYQKKTDQISQAQSDLKKLGLNDNLENLKLMRKSKLGMKLEKFIKEYAFHELNIKKDSHSKVRNVEH